MTSRRHPPLSFVWVLPWRTGPSAVTLNTFTTLWATHSALPDVTFPWNRSVVGFHLIEIWLATAANAVCAPRTPIVAAISTVSSFFCIRSLLLDYDIRDAFDRREGALRTPYTRLAGREILRAEP